MAQSFIFCYLDLRYPSSHGVTSANKIWGFRKFNPNLGSFNLNQVNHPMKKLLFLLMAIALFACNENPKGFDSKIFTEKEVSDFIRVNPQWTKNAETAAETTEKFKHRLINLSNEKDFLKDFPFQLKAQTDSLVDGQSVKVAVFRAFKDEARPKESLLNQLELEIRAIMSADQVAQFAVDKKYTLQGMLYKQGKRADVQLNQAGETPIYNLGRYTFWNIAAKPL